MKEQIKTPKIELSKEEIANPSDAEFKTLVIRMLTEMVEYDRKVEEKVNTMKGEIKENVQGTNTEGKETTQISGLDQKEEINSQPEQNEETRIQKRRRGLGTSRTTLNISTSEYWGCQKEKRKSKKLKTYLKNNEGELPQSGKRTRLPGSPGSSESPKEVGLKEAHTKAHQNYITQD